MVYLHSVLWVSRKLIPTFIFLLREDSRNKNGGAWIFRVPKANSQEFWKEILMMAIGEVLQEVVHKGSFYIFPFLN